VTRSGIVWRLLDPLVRRLHARIRHHEETSPEAHAALRHREVAEFPPSVRWFSDSRVFNSGPRDRVRVGAHSHVRGELYVVAETGSIRIGSHCYVGPGSRVWSQSRVEIGDRVLISHLVDVHDTDSHPLDVAARARDAVDRFEHGEAAAWRDVRCAPVRIGDDVWIGLKATVLKGVTIGSGSVVAAGAVVTTDVPPGSLVAGNPARVVRSLGRP
jgi:acetyltransferase-like isoleucine patch superfamily enzyme